MVIGVIALNPQSLDAIEAIVGRFTGVPHMDVPSTPHKTSV